MNFLKFDRQHTGRKLRETRRVATAKTNAVRLLEQAGVPHQLLEYEVDPADLAAESVAVKVGLPPERVFKTLVARGDRRGVCFAVIPGDAALDLKALARATGDRKVETVALKEVQPLTGYIRGGVTVLGAKKAYPVYLDEAATRSDQMAVSAGRRGCQILLRPADYIAASQARVVAIAREKDSTR